MKTTARNVVFPLLLVLGTAATLNQVPLKAATTKCKEIRTTFVNKPFDQVCTSPIGICSLSIVHTGFLKGEGRGTTQAAAVRAGLPAAFVADTTFSLSTDFVVTTADGTFDTRGITLVDTANHLFVTQHLIVGGTGKFVGATGNFWGIGKQTPGGENLAEGEIIGEICFQE